MISDNQRKFGKFVSFVVRHRLLLLVSCIIFTVAFSLGALVMSKKFALCSVLAIFLIGGFVLYINGGSDSTVTDRTPQEVANQDPLREKEPTRTLPKKKTAGNNTALIQYSDQGEINKGASRKVEWVVIDSRTGGPVSGAKIRLRRFSDLQELRPEADFWKLRAKESVGKTNEIGRFVQTLKPSARRLSRRISMMRRSPRL